MDRSFTRPGVTRGLGSRQKHRWIGVADDQLAIHNFEIDPARRRRVVPVIRAESQVGPALAVLSPKKDLECSTLVPVVDRESREVRVVSGPDELPRAVEPHDLAVEVAHVGRPEACERIAEQHQLR